MDDWLLRGEGEGEGVSGAAEVLPKQEDNQLHLQLASPRPSSPASDASFEFKSAKSCPRYWKKDISLGFPIGAMHSTNVGLWIY